MFSIVGYSTLKTHNQDHWKQDSPFNLTALTVQLLSLMAWYGLYFGGVGMLTASAISGGTFLTVDAIAAGYYLSKSAKPIQKSKKTDHHPLFPCDDFSIAKIYNYLGVEDVTNLSLVNRHASCHGNSYFLRKSRVWGYQGSDFIEAKGYIRDLTYGLKQLAKKGFFFEAELIFYPSRFHRKINLSATIDHLFALPEREKQLIRHRLEKPLCSYAKRGDSRMVRALLILGVNPNCQNRELKTPLHLAIQKDRIEIVKILLKKGADPNMADPDGFTPICINTSNPELTQLLIDHGAQVDYRIPVNGNTALSYASRKHQTETVRVLKQALARRNDGLS